MKYFAFDEYRSGRKYLLAHPLKLRVNSLTYSYPFLSHHLALKIQLAKLIFIVLLPSRTLLCWPQVLFSRPTLFFNHLFKEAHKQKLCTRSTLWSLRNIISKIHVLKGPLGHLFFARQIIVSCEYVLNHSSVSLEQASDLWDPFTQNMLNFLHQRLTSLALVYKTSCLFCACSLHSLFSREMEQLQKVQSYRVLC